MHRVSLYGPQPREYEKSCFFCICFLRLASGSIQNASGASALAMGETRGGPIYSLGSGWSLREAQQRAIRRAWEHGLKYGIDSVRIVATSDVGGYGAVAVSGFRKSRVFGVAFGYRSSIEAEKRALEDCRKKGGNDPRIKWSFKDRGSDNFG
jgi:hypothetical protein